MNKLDTKTRAQLIGCLVEGNSPRATSRLTGVAFNTVLKLVPAIGHACRRFQNEAFRNLNCRRLQLDEIWQFCYAKAKNVPDEKKDTFGDVWTWVAIDADTKLVPCWLVGKRDSECAIEFVRDLAGRLRHRVQITSDGHRPYIMAVEDAFGSDVDYAMLIKMYGKSQVETETRYSPAQCIGMETKIMCGDPDGDHISTSYVERQNLTMRMSMRRFTRLTNGFSKKLANHAAAIALHYMHYNFCRIHKTLRVTPAMEAGLTDHVWSLEDIGSLLDVNVKSAKRGPYKKKSA